MKEIAQHDHLPDYRLIFDEGKDMVVFFNRENAWVERPLPASYDDATLPPLPTEAYEKAREAAPGYDIHALEAIGGNSGKARASPPWLTRRQRLSAFASTVTQSRRSIAHGVMMMLTPLPARQNVGLAKWPESASSPPGEHGVAIMVKTLLPALPLRPCAESFMLSCPDTGALPPIQLEKRLSESFRIAGGIPKESGKLSDICLSSF